jgi:hypothetical protein
MKLPVDALLPEIVVAALRREGDGAACPACLQIPWLLGSTAPVFLDLHGVDSGCPLRPAGGTVVGIVGDGLRGKVIGRFGDYGSVLSEP